VATIKKDQFHKKWPPRRDSFMRLLCGNRSHKLHVNNTKGLVRKQYYFRDSPQGLLA